MHNSAQPQAVRRRRSTPMLATVRAGITMSTTPILNPQGPLRRVGYWRLDPEIERYLTPLLLERWPHLRAECHQSTEALTRIVVDVWVCGDHPGVIPISPTVILGQIAPHPTIEAIAAHVWKLATPITGRRLLASIQGVRQNGKGGA